MRSQRFGCRPRHHVHIGSMPARRRTSGSGSARHACRRRGRRRPRGPGVNGNETIGSKYRDEWPSIVARSRAADAGEAGTHADPARRRAASGSSTSRNDSGPTVAPLPGTTRPATRRRGVARRLALEHERLHRAAPLVGGAIGRSLAGPAGRLRELLDQPAPLAGDRGETGLGVDRDREADDFEHRKIGRRVCVRDRLRERESFRVGVVEQRLARDSPVGGTSVSSPA